MWRSSPSLFSWLHMTPDDDDQRDARQVVAARVARRGGRASGPANAWPDDDDVRDVQALDRREQLVDVEPAMLQGDDGAPGGHGDERRELTRAVHQRAGHQHDGARRLAGVDPIGQLVDAGARGRADQRVAARAEHVEQVVLRHMTPFGMPVVPPVYSSSRSSPLRDHATGGSVAPLVATVSYGDAHAGPSPVSSPTTYQRRTLPKRSRMPFEQLGEAGVEHHGLGVGVVEQVDDLVRAVAVVRVDRHHRRLERGDHGLHVLGTVVQVAGHLGLMAQAGGDEVGGQRVGPAVELAPRDRAIALDLARPIGHSCGDRLEDVGEVPVGRGVLGHWFPRC